MLSEREKKNTILIKKKTTTMSNLNESSIKQFALELIQFLGWESIFGPDIAPNSKKYNLRISRITSLKMIYCVI